MDEGYDAINVARAYDLAAGRPLATLPPEAFELRGQPRPDRRRPSQRPRAALTTAASPPGPRVVHGRSTLAVLLGLLALAALMRLPDLATRGTWDADQGHDMLVLRAFVRDGVVPLLGPPTSIGDFHHGAWYYFLLAPAAR